MRARPALGFCAKMFIVISYRHRHLSLCLSASRFYGVPHALIVILIGQ